MGRSGHNGAPYRLKAANQETPRWSRVFTLSRTPGFCARIWLIESRALGCSPKEPMHFAPCIKGSKDLDGGSCIATCTNVVDTRSELVGRCCYIDVLAELVGAVKTLYRTTGLAIWAAATYKTRFEHPFNPIVVGEEFTNVA